MRREFISMVLLIFTVAPSLSSADSQFGFGPDVMAEQFEQVVFTGGEHGNRVTVVRKWAVSPGLALFKPPGYDVRPYTGLLSRHLEDIGELTGLPVHLAAVPTQATLRFGFYPRAEFVNMPGDKNDPEFVRWVTTSACIAMAVSSPNDRGSIIGGAIVVGTDIQPNQREHCILEELVQVMGLPNDACHYRPSLFCEDDRVFELEPADRILVRALYDPRLKIGTPKDEAMQLVKLIIAELVAVAEVAQVVQQ